MSDKGGGEFVVGFLVGALAGAAAALLFTPASGDELRKQIEEKGIELKDQATRLAEEARVQAREQVSQARERGRIVLAENVKKMQEIVQETQEKLGKTDAVGA